MKNIILKIIFASFLFPSCRKDSDTMTFHKGQFTQTELNVSNLKDEEQAADEGYLHLALDNSEDANKPFLSQLDPELKPDDRVIIAFHASFAADEDESESEDLELAGLPKSTVDKAQKVIDRLKTTIRDNVAYIRALQISKTSKSNYAGNTVGKDTKMQDDVFVYRGMHSVDDATGKKISERGMYCGYAFNISKGEINKKLTTNILKHQDSKNAKRSGFVSTSTDPSVARQFASSPINGGIIWVMNGKGGIDVNKLSNKYKDQVETSDIIKGYSKEKEVAIKGIVLPHNIVGYHKVNAAGEIGEFVANPKYKGPPYRSQNPLLKNNPVPSATP